MRNTTPTKKGSQSIWKKFETKNHPRAPGVIPLGREIKIWPITSVSHDKSLSRYSVSPPRRTAKTICPRKKPVNTQPEWNKKPMIPGTMNAWKRSAPMARHFFITLEWSSSLVSCAYSSDDEDHSKVIKKCLAKIGRAHV